MLDMAPWLPRWIFLSFFLRQRDVFVFREKFIPMFRPQFAIHSARSRWPMLAYALYLVSPFILEGKWDGLISRHA